MLLYLYRSEIVVGTNSSSCSEVHADLCKYLLIIAPKEKGEKKAFGGRGCGVRLMILALRRGGA